MPAILLTTAASIILLLASFALLPGSASTFFSLAGGQCCSCGREYMQTIRNVVSYYCALVDSSVTQPVGTSILCHDDQPVGQCANLQFTDSFANDVVNVCCTARQGTMTNYTLEGQSSCEQCELLE